jgi:hypothetical protein
MKSIVICNALWELPTYLRHCEISKRSLADELSALEIEMDKQLTDLNQREQDSFFRDINDRWIETAETLPRLQWYSQLLTVYGYFEKLLNDLCIEQRDAKKLPLSLKDLHGQGIERARNYLVKLVGLNKAFSTTEWQRIKSIGVLRNSVAHRDGFVDFEPDNSKSTYSKLNKISSVELRQETINQDDAQIFFGEQVIIDTIELFDIFIRRLDLELSNG